ncbi:glycosyltransferase family 2 protein [Curtobacterium sp. MCBA15_012]|uniref:glycosyltransferase family 2 protein n=1 Tax=Curtobacterium sp. MCBA15_012 TaxID=1898738 RepID=UPI0008DE793D|nr:glycosyltransferase family 2 protein [Curtobacterium sp. MCBA15_012]WIA99018.1 glycosyltransferase family 2 protein [Curtobacterium sp. MCBA15_012]
MSPAVEVVVVNWRRADLTIECVESLLPQLAEVDAVVTVVDNASGDGSVERLRSALPGVRVLESPVNGGFGAGVDLAAGASTADVLVLLNNDAVARPGFLRALTAPVLDGSVTGATTARILLRAEPGEPVRTNSTGNVVDRSGNGGDRDWLVPHPADADPEVFGFCGGACAIAMPAFRQAGGFDESLFMYYEDTDLSWRLRRLGHGVRFVGDAVAVHRHASSLGTGSAGFVTANTRNRVVVAVKNAPWGVVARAVARTVVRTALDSAARDPRARDRGRAERHGLAQAVTRLPAALRARRTIDRTATAPRPRLDG